MVYYKFICIFIGLLDFLNNKTDLGLPIFFKYIINVVSQIDVMWCRVWVMRKKILMARCNVASRNLTHFNTKHHKHFFKSLKVSHTNLYGEISADDVFFSTDMFCFFHGNVIITSLSSHSSPGEKSITFSGISLWSRLSIYSVPKKLH